MTEAQAKRLATKSVSSILDKGLAASTWRDNNEGAYNELFKYREDLIASVKRVLLSSPPKPRKKK